MSDETNGQSTEGTGAPASAPAQSPEEIQALVNDAVGQRIPGLQAAYEKQLATLRTELAESRSDPDQYEASASSKLQAELDDSRRETEALRVAREYPEVFPVFEAITAAKTAKAQLDLLQAFVQGSAPAAPAVPAAQAAPAAPAVPLEPAPVNPNRPAPPAAPAPDFVPDGEMSKDLADRIIDGVGAVWPKW